MKAQLPPEGREASALMTKECSFVRVSYFFPRIE